MAIPAIAMEILMNQKLTHAAQNVSNVCTLDLKVKKENCLRIERKKSITKRLLLKTKVTVLSLLLQLGLGFLSIDDTAAHKHNARGSSTAKVSTSLKSNAFENAKLNASKIKRNARKNRRTASEKSAEKLMLNVSAHSVSATSMKPDRKSIRTEFLDGRTLEQQRQMRLRRSRSAECNKVKNLQEFTTKRDDDGTNEPFVLEATSLAPARIRSNDNIAQGIPANIK